MKLYEDYFDFNLLATIHGLLYGYIEFYLHICICVMFYMYSLYFCICMLNFVFNAYIYIYFYLMTANRGLGI